MPDYLYIGLDFGTTFSGAAWALSRQPDRIKIITKWKSDYSYNTDDAKVPTALVYEEPKIVYEDDDGKRPRTTTGWGNNIKLEESPLRWFKLCLVDEENLSPDVQRSAQLRDAKAKLEELGISAVEAAADYLRFLWKHTLASIEREIGKRAIDGLPFRVIVTVPAMWPIDAMVRTEQAAKRAGILEARVCGNTKLDLVPEPEAAALATLAEFKGRPGIEEDDVITVCDCGGGTIDITSYQIEKTDPVVLVKECVSGEGEMCGSIFVDENFEKVMVKRLDKRWDKLRPEQRKKVLNSEWEYGIKRLFENDGRNWEVRLPAEAVGHTLGGYAVFRKKSGKKHDSSADRSIAPTSAGSLKLTQDDVRGIFDPVVDRIKNLVKKQVQEIMNSVGSLNKPPKCILLVGGFGRCPYLYHSLTETLGPQGIEILQADGDGPWTAICRGAVIKALSDSRFEAEVKVKSRVSRYNYGVPHESPFNPKIHREEDKVWSDRRCEWQATDQMTWYLRKGENITSHQPVKFDFTELFESASDLPNNQFECDVWTSDVADAPDRVTDETKELFSLMVEVETPFKDLPIFVNRKGESYREVHFEIELTCAGTLLKFAAIVNGRRQKSKTVKAEYRSQRKHQDRALLLLPPRGASRSS